MTNSYWIGLNLAIRTTEEAEAERIVRRLRGILVRAAFEAGAATTGSTSRPDRDRETFEIRQPATGEDGFADLSIDVLDLPIKPHNALKRGQIETLGDLMVKTEVELLNLANFGQGALNTVIDRLEAFGIELKER